VLARLDFFGGQVAALQTHLQDLDQGFGPKGHHADGWIIAFLGLCHLLLALGNKARDILHLVGGQRIEIRDGGLQGADQSQHVHPVMRCARQRLTPAAKKIAIGLIVESVAVPEITPLVVSFHVVTRHSPSGLPSDVKIA